MGDTIEKRTELRVARARRTRIAVKRNKARLRLAVFRSTKHIYAQIIDDNQGNTLVSSSTLLKEFKKAEPRLKGKAAAQWVGKDIAGKAIAKGIKKIIFDRGRFLYHGRVKALADAARESGLEF